MSIPMLDLAAQTAELRPELDRAIAAVLDSGRFVLGPVVASFEQEAADYLGVAHTVGVASGTDALHLALRALGIGPGDEVITPSFTFVATAEAIAQTGATPVFADIEPDTYTLDPLAVEAAIGPATRAVLAVHLYGHPANMTALRRICDRHGLPLVEDAAQAFGATWHGVRCGALGDIACFSFYPSKNLGAFGDGGLVSTSSAALADRVRGLREHGHVGGYRHMTLGYNSRLDALQAAVLRVKLPHLDGWNARRRAVAQVYDDGLTRAGLQPPVEGPGARHVYHQYTVRTARRDALQAALRDADIGSVVYYPVPVHRQPSFAAYTAGDLPATDQAAAEVLSLPMGPHLTMEQAEAVAEVVVRVCG